jgi:hypothetical protein
VGKLVGWAIKLALRDHLQRKKSAIDTTHCASKEIEEPEGTGQQPHTVEAG